MQTNGSYFMDAHNNKNDKKCMRKVTKNNNKKTNNGIQKEMNLF